MRRILAGAGIIVVAILAGAGTRSVSAHDAANKPEFYTEKVRPILVTNCGSCHFNMNHAGGLSMDTQAGMMKGGMDGAVIVAGDPANSLLVKLIRHEGPADDPMPMPPRGAKLRDEDIDVVEQWVKAGAVMPPDPPPAAQ